MSDNLPVRKALNRARLRGIEDPSNPTLPTPTTRMLINYYMRKFDLEDTARTFGTNVHAVRRVIESPRGRSYIDHRLGELEPLEKMLQRRLLEEAAQDAFMSVGTDQWLIKRQIEARKLIDRRIPVTEKKEVEHRFVIRAPEKAKSTEDWAAQFKPQASLPDPTIVDAEFTVEGEDD